MMEGELAQLRAEIEELKRLRLQEILAELEESIQLREAQERPPLRFCTISDDGCGVIAPVRPARRAKP